MASMTLLQTTDLKCHFGGLKAVDGVDFQLQQGEIRAIIGPNGAGKTTFVSLLSGRVPPSGGKIHFKGEDVTRLPAFRRVGRGIAYTFQITNIYVKLAVRENVAIALQSRLSREDGKRWKAGALADEVEMMLIAVGLQGRADEKAGELAYGHQRLLEVAMGLSLRPALLILDEPTQGLSDVEVENFCSLVRRVSQSATVLLIEHNMQVVMQLAHRITVLNRGRILAEGNPAQIRANSDVQAAYLGGA